MFNIKLFRFQSLSVVIFPVVECPHTPHVLYASAFLQSKMQLNIFKNLTPILWSAVLYPLIGLHTSLQHLNFVSNSMAVQWNPSKMDTIGEMKYVLYMEVSLFQGFSKTLK